MGELHPVLQTAAVTGNGRMLACLSPGGVLTKLFWPHIDYGQHMGKFYPGIITRGGDGAHTRWLHDDNWRTEQQYLPSAATIHTVYHGDHKQLGAEQWSFVLPGEDVLVNRYRLSNTAGDVLHPTFILYFTFRVAESDQFDSMYIDFNTFTAIQYRRDVYLAVGVMEDLEPAGYHCGRINTPSDPFDGASRGMFGGNHINLGRSAGGLSWNTGRLNPEEHRHITTFIAAAHTAESVLQTVRRLKSKLTDTWPDNGGKYWQGWVERSFQPRPNPVDEQDLHNLYQRSLITIKLLQDDSGGFIAAPEFDPLYRTSGGYGYCWLRDALYSAVALDEAGYRDEAERFYLFAASIQNPGGDWEQRYFMNGNPAPSWGKQIDQTGCILWGFLHHHRLRGDTEFAARVWPTVQKAAAYLHANLAENHLPRPSIDPWEERLSQGTYSAAAVYGGLRAASLLAGDVGEYDLFKRWSETAAKVRQAITGLQWGPDIRRFYRGIGKRIDQNEFNYLRENGVNAWEERDPSGLYVTYWNPVDDNIDSSLLALGFPFNVLPPGDEKLLDTARWIEFTLWNHKVGGLHRYDGDNYSGGNPWIISTLWLALYYYREGHRERAGELLSWCRRHTNHNLLLPEQVHKENGGPAWVLPLKWSHAMYVITYLALNDRVVWLNLYP